MGTASVMFPEARIPYGTWGSSYFPAWQTSALAEVNIGQFAGEAMNRILGMKKVPKSQLEYLVIGSTIPWHWKFWNAPLVASCLGNRIPGYHVEQACATGFASRPAGWVGGSDRLSRCRRCLDLRSHQRLSGGSLPGATRP